MVTKEEWDAPDAKLKAWDKWRAEKSNAAPVDRSGSRGPGHCVHKVSLNEHCDECLHEREAELAREQDDGSAA